MDWHGPGSRLRARPRGRRVLVAVLAIVILAATTGCAGRKGRNDDDPGPREYSSSVTGAPLVAPSPR